MPKKGQVQLRAHARAASASLAIEAARDSPDELSGARWHLVGHEAQACGRGCGVSGRAGPRAQANAADQRAAGISVRGAGSPVPDLPRGPAPIPSFNCCLIANKSTRRSRATRTPVLAARPRFASRVRALPVPQRPSSFEASSLSRGRLEDAEYHARAEGVNLNLNTPWSHCISGMKSVP